MTLNRLKRDSFNGRNRISRVENEEAAEEEASIDVKLAGKIMVCLRSSLLLLLFPLIYVTQSKLKRVRNLPHYFSAPDLLRLSSCSDKDVEAAAAPFLAAFTPT